MQFRVVDSGDASPHRQSSLISYVVDRQIALDAGGLALMPSADQKQITTIFLSHVHADHIATLPLFVDNVYRPGPECITLYANESTIHDLKQHVFNDRIWPDLLRLSEQASPFIEFRPIAHGQAVQIKDLRVTAFDCDHTIPTLGFVVEDASAAVAVISDTAPCEAIWEFLSHFDKLKAVFLEISFPNSMQWLANASKHLTPATFQSETSKLKRSVEWYITHVKPEFTEHIDREVNELAIDHCHFAMSACDYWF